MKMKKKTTALLLCCVLLFACATPAFGERFEATEQADRYTYTELFNKSVNRIKWDRPFGLVTYTNGVPKNGITVGDAFSGDEIDSAISRWLVPVLEGMFNNSSNMTQSFIKAIFHETVNPETKIVLNRDESRDDVVPLYGQNVVSRLNSEKTDYSVFVDGEEGYCPDQVAVIFPETKLEDAENASISDVFSLPDGTIDPVVVGDREKAGSDLLIKARLQNLRFANARAALQFDQYGDLSYYGTSVDYKFDMSFYDAMNIANAFIGLDFYSAIINTINTVYANVGREAVDPENVMKERSLHVTYRCAVEVTELSWQSRDFGDVDGDGEVTAGDARAALRHSVGLDPLGNRSDLIYTDVDFDGAITAADARVILRISVGLDAPIWSVPDGQTVRITMEDPPEPSSPGTDPNQKTGWFSDIRIDTTPADIAQSIFDIVGVIRDSEQQIREAAGELSEIANQ